MTVFQAEAHPHRRFNPLTNEWVLVSPHRTQRPWQGQQEAGSGEIRPSYDSTCYLCPGNTRANGSTNPLYGSTFVFANDYAAILPESREIAGAADRLFRSEPVAGECRVICFSPRHDLTLAQMSLPEIGSVVEEWVRQDADLGKKWAWAQIFENKGAVMGCSNPHPHGQVWASDCLPTLISREAAAQKDYFSRHHSPLLRDVASRESELGERVVVENDDWIIVVPFWATWPFETLLLPKKPMEKLSDLSDSDRLSLSEILRSNLIRYDNLFETSFPYSMGWHGAPAGAEGWQLHAHFYPPLLRSATVKKFMVGYELLAEAQRDLTPESAAERLSELPGEHYSHS